MIDDRFDVQVECRGCGDQLLLPTPVDSVVDSARITTFMAAHQSHGDSTGFRVLLPYVQFDAADDGDGDALRMS